MRPLAARAAAAVCYPARSFAVGKRQRVAVGIAIQASTVSGSTGHIPLPSQESGVGS